MVKRLSPINLIISIIEQKLLLKPAIPYEAGRPINKPTNVDRNATMKLLLIGLKIIILEYLG